MHSPLKASQKRIFNTLTNGGTKGAEAKASSGDTEIGGTLDRGLYTEHAGVVVEADERVRYVNIRQRTSAYVSIRQYTSDRGLDTEHAGVVVVEAEAEGVDLGAYVSIRQHTSAYVSIRRCCCRSGSGRSGLSLSFSFKILTLNSPLEYK